MRLGPRVRCKPLTRTVHYSGYPADPGSRPAQCASFPGPEPVGVRAGPNPGSRCANRPDTERREPVKPAARRKQAINRQRAGLAATTGLALSAPPSRRPRSRPTTRGGGLPNGILQQESGRMRNKQRTGAEQVLNRPSSHEHLSRHSPPLQPAYGD